jgi:hypothetical protein
MAIISWSKRRTIYREFNNDQRCTICILLSKGYVTVQQKFILFYQYLFIFNILKDIT